MLVFDIDVPVIAGNRPHAVLSGLKTLAPKFSAFAFSFVIIAVYWGGHHAMISQLRYVTGKLLWLNLRPALAPLSGFPQPGSA